MTDTVITSIQEKALVCLVLHCTGSQACPLCQVNNSSVSTNQNTRPHWSFSSHVPISGWACQQTSQQFRSLVASTVLISEQRRLLMLALGWINSEPHCNRGWGHDCSYLRGTWHLKYTNRNDGYLMLLIEGVGFSMSSKTVPSPLTVFHFLFVSLLSFSSCLYSVRGAELSISTPSLRWR